ncbi:DUF2125 domain-containing protein [Acuticoccus mangrovi]|uniref:DUF2125 domain-containing protein n=1 Tax=Acuticoccus mangrovi TaxID=2796142 RepID=A0A934IR83_9HYPH|nr:DUF2125 domain-containing protein [Acuticoccus mangrovi]MBJ3777185.1 DUF2125 domain-containing protein [Acuticoccus mangrovi]
MAKRSGALRFKILLGVALVAIVGWSVLWFMAAGIVDRQMKKAELGAQAAGMIASCNNRSVTGFPFRIEVRCTGGSRVGNGDARTTVGGLTVVAQVYSPNRVLAEVEGPAELVLRDMRPVIADWTLAHASARLNFGARSLERLDAEIKQATVDVVGGIDFSVGEVDANLRRSPDNPRDLDVALNLQRVRPIEGGAPADVTFVGRLGDGAALIAGQADALLEIIAAQGVPLTIERATFASGDLAVSASGVLTLGADGKVDGEVDLAIAGHDGELPYVATMAPQAEATLRTLFKNVLAFAPETQLGKRTGKKISLTIRDGRVMAGFVPLATLPSVSLNVPR